MLVRGSSRTWLSNIPRAIGPVQEEREIEFVDVDAEEAGMVAKAFEASFWSEEEALRMCRGPEYVIGRLPPVMVMSKKSVEKE